MKLRIGLAMLIVIAGGLLFSAFALSYYITHGSDGPRHVYALIGDGPISDDDALKFSTEALSADRRFYPAWEWEKWVDGSTVLRGGNDPAFVTVCLHQPGTNNRYYVELKRSPGKVECVSSPGK